MSDQKKVCCFDFQYFCKIQNALTLKPVENPFSKNQFIKKQNKKEVDQIKRIIKIIIIIRYVQWHL